MHIQIGHIRNTERDETGNDENWITIGNDIHSLIEFLNNCVESPQDYGGGLVVDDELLKDYWFRVVDDDNHG